MRVGIVGLNHKLANLTLRERLSKACQSYFCDYVHDDHSFVLLSTCNRTEIYFSSEDLTGTHTFLLDLLRRMVPEEFDQKLYSYFGHDCFLHLARVVAGLDSAIVAETEIQGQVKNTYESVSAKRRLPKELHYLFQKTLKIGKLIRSEYAMGRGMPDIEHAVYTTASQYFEDIKDRNILIVGASAINHKIVNYLKLKQCSRLTICNRTIARGQQTAASLNIPFTPLHTVNWTSYNCLIFGTKSQEHLLNTHTLRNVNSSKLIIDLSVPRNVDPALSKHPLINLLDIDELNCSLHMRKEQMLHLLRSAEKRASMETQKHVHLYYKREKRRQLYLV